MVRKLQRRFILITMVSVISIFILILAVLNISVSYSAMQHGYATLQDYAMRDTADGIKALDTPDNIQISNPQKIHVSAAAADLPLCWTPWHFPDLYSGLFPVQMDHQACADRL